MSRNTERYWKEYFRTTHFTRYPERLNFKCSELDDEGLAFVSQAVKGVGQLDLDETLITNEGLAALRKLDFVREIRLKGISAIDRNSIDTLIEIKGLELLHLHGTGITPIDATGFHVIPTLKILILSSHGATPHDISELKKWIPHCRILIDHQEI